MDVPYISGEWNLLFRPEKYGNYVNDHSLIQDGEGKWHLFGITSHGGKSTEERYFVHGVGDGLDKPLTECGKVIDRGTLAWAPCVVEKNKDYYMFYGPSPTQLSVSFDMLEWYNYPVVLKDEPLMAAHRDHFILKVDEGRYLMYVVGVHNRRSAVSLFESLDLLNWSFRGFALTSGQDAPLNPGWGAMESPFVIKRKDTYYLFVTYTDCSKENYHDTLVFASDTPYSFGEYNGGACGAVPITKLHAHAPEIIKVGEEYFITTCGWLGYETPHEGGVSIAPLDWK